MPQLGQARTGSLRSTPKQLRVTASDNTDALFKSVGNSHNVPSWWGSSATVSSGTTEVVVTSGVKFYDMDLASYATITATPLSDPGARYWIDKDTSSNVIKLVIGSSAASDIEFDLHFSLGSNIDISTWNTRGTGAPAQSYP